MVHLRKEKGDIATAKVIADLTEKEYVILTPTVSEHLPFDLIAYKDNKCLRIQAKYSSTGLISHKNVWNDKHGSHVKYYGNNDFDYYGIYFPSVNKIVYPSIKFGGAKIATKVPNSATPFYWWEDFLSLTDKAEKRIYRDFGVELNRSWQSNPVFKAGTPQRKELDERHRKVARPSKEELQKLLWQKPTSQLAKDFGVSDKAIEKWAKTYGLEKPGRGYWSQLPTKFSY